MKNTMKMILIQTFITDTITKSLVILFNNIKKNY